MAVTAGLMTTSVSSDIYKACEMTLKATRTGPQPGYYAKHTRILRGRLTRHRKIRTETRYPVIRERRVRLASAANSPAIRGALSRGRKRRAHAPPSRRAAGKNGRERARAKIDAGQPDRIMTASDAWRLPRDRSGPLNLCALARLCLRATGIASPAPLPASPPPRTVGPSCFV